MKPARRAKKIRILVADREGVFRLGLLRLFGLEDDLRVVAQAETGEQVVRLAKQFKPDVLMVQAEILAEPAGNLVERIRSASSHSKIIITASALAEDLVPRYLQAGVSGVIPRLAAPSRFVEALRGVLRHKPGTLKAPGTAAAKTPAGSIRGLTRPVDTLTQREKAVISHLMQGFGNREIAQRLSIAEQTVKNHLRAIFDKVGVSDRLELVLYAIHQRLELPPVGP
jgi:two-component system nitrate/nitrite response regulator NarL